MKLNFKLMKKYFFILLLTFLSTMSFAQENLLKDGSFENQNVYHENEIARIAAFSDLGKSVQAANPKVEQGVEVQVGTWYKKSANSGYLRATIIEDDCQDGEKAILLAIRQNSPQAGLDKWYGTVLTQYVKVKRGKTYVLKFAAKSTENCEKVYAGIIGESGDAAKGSKWVNINTEWKEYEVIVTPGANSSAVIIGISTTYNSEGKTNQSSVTIDNVRLYEK